MSSNFQKISSGIFLKSLATAPSNPNDGDIYYDTGLFKAYLRVMGGQWLEIG